MTTHLIAASTILAGILCGSLSLAIHIARTRAKLGIGTFNAPKRYEWPSVDYKGMALFREPTTDRWNL